VPREIFIEAYVRLRVAALQTLTGQIVPAERDRILQEMGLTPEDLLRFVEVHGRNVPYMKEVWEEVDRRLETRRQTVDTAGSG